MRSVGLACVTALSLVPAVTGLESSAGAAGTVSSTPASWTPYLASADSTVQQLVPAGNTMYAVGAFSSISDSGGHVFGRSNVFAFSATTGAVSSWAPNANGTVYSAAVSADGNSVYLGGSFTTINGVSAPKLAKVSASTGAVDTTFKSRASGSVKALWLDGSHLIVGGTFTTLGGSSHQALASLNPTTGTDDGYINLNVSGAVAGDSLTRVVTLQPSHAGTRLLAMGNFTSVAGSARQHIFMVDLGTSASLDPWNSVEFMQSCASSIPVWLQAANWSPDDSDVAIAATGYHGTSPLCDSSALFSSTGVSLVPLWINKTGCDSLYSTVLTSDTVYVAGHERWANNPNGCDSAGPGAVSRPGLGAIGLINGLATSWNPTRSRGHTADDMELTASGLWVASDNTNSANYCAGRYHPGICMFPIA